MLPTVPTTSNEVRSKAYLQKAALNHSQPPPASYVQAITQQERVTHCLLFILQPIYLHNQSPHTSSQPIKSRVY